MSACPHCHSAHIFTTHHIDTGRETLSLDGYCCDRAQDDDARMDAMADAYDDEATLTEALARGEVDARDPDELVRDWMGVGQ